jgi:hypothetical protein
VTTVTARPFWVLQRLHPNREWDPAGNCRSVLRKALKGFKVIINEGIYGQVRLWSAFDTPQLATTDGITPTNRLLYWGRAGENPGAGIPTDK